MDGVSARPEEALRSLIDEMDKIANADWDEVIETAIEEVLDKYRNLNFPARTGIHCPECGSTWYDDGFTSGCPSCRIILLERKVERLETRLVRCLPACFVCPECGPFAEVDEDDCCTSCGRDCEIKDSKVAIREERGDV